MGLKRGKGVLGLRLFMRRWAAALHRRMAQWWRLLLQRPSNTPAPALQNATDSGALALLHVYCPQVLSCDLTRLPNKTLHSNPLVSFQQQPS